MWKKHNIKEKTMCAKTDFCTPLIYWNILNILYSSLKIIKPYISFKNIYIQLFKLKDNVSSIFILNFSHCDTVRIVLIFCQNK